MVFDLNNLPSDIPVLHKMLAALNNNIQSLITENQSLTTENQSLTTENQSLREQLALLKAKRYGKSSEKLDKQIEEIELKIEENELILGFKTEQDNVNSDKSIATVDDSKQKPKRQKLPEHLPREAAVLKPVDQCPACGGVEFRKISDDISETLEYVPSSFKVIRHVRSRCACTHCEKIVQAYAPSKAIDKGKPGSGLLAHILIQKYCNHLPLYRQSQIYEREGVEISRTTMASWAGQCARLLEPIAKAIQQCIFSGKQIHGDDTQLSVRVLAPGIGKTKIGRIWTYVSDGRPHGDQSPVAVCYFYSPDRKGTRPLEHLKDFTGVLHADAYAGYNQLYIDDEKSAAKIKEAACWAHVRRKFYEVTIANDKANIAIAILEQIGKIYGIEADIRGLEADKRLEERQKKSKVLVEKLFAGFRKAYDQLPKKSSTAKAISYALNNQNALMKFLDNGTIEIDNNAAERAMRSIAIGRKNWLFAGSDNGGHTAAIIYSIIETAKLNNINPWKYLQKVLATIQDYKANKIADLLPWNIILE